MKRIIAVSDSHGDRLWMRQAFEQARSRGVIDAAVFLGDGLTDFDEIRPMLAAEGTLCYAVRGNNDWSAKEPYDQTFMLSGVRFFLTHGHHLHVKYGLDRLWYAARECEAQVALYGHTHSEGIELERGMYLINPGAVCERAPKRSAYAELLVDDNGYIRPSLVKWDK